MAAVLHDTAIFATGLAAFLILVWLLSMLRSSAQRERAWTAEPVPQRKPTPETVRLVTERARRDSVEQIALRYIGREPDLERERR